MAAKPKRAADHARTADQVRAWELRQRGWTQVRIARELGNDQGTVSRWLEAIERKELARLSERAQQIKVVQNGVLEHCLDEALQAWERSKTPRRRVTQKQGDVVTGPDGQALTRSDGTPLRTDPTEVIEVIARDGDPSYLDRAFVSLTHMRRLWGLDVAPKQNDEGGPLSFASIVQRVKLNAQKHDAK